MEEICSAWLATSGKNRTSWKQSKENTHRSVKLHKGRQTLKGNWLILISFCFVFLSFYGQSQITLWSRHHINEMLIEEVKKYLKRSQRPSEQTKINHQSKPVTGQPVTFSSWHTAVCRHAHLSCAEERGRKKKHAIVESILCWFWYFHWIC